MGVGLNAALLHLAESSFMKVGAGYICSHSHGYGGSCTYSDLTETTISDGHTEYYLVVVVVKPPRFLGPSPHFLGRTVEDAPAQGRSVGTGSQVAY